MSSPVRPYRGVSAADRRASRRAALLDAALDLLGGDPAGPVTMTAICQRAGLTERYFYESFEDRDALLVELLDGIAAEILDAALGALDTGGETVEERARASVAALVRIFADDPRKGRVALVESVTIPALRRRRQELLDGFERLVSDRTRELYGERAWSAPDDRIEALLFVGGLAELLSGWLTGAVAASPDEVVDAVTRHYLATSHR